MSRTDRIRTLAELGKLRITLLATVSTLTCFILAGGASALAFLATASGVFLLAAGASAINHYQDRKMDALMVRTAKRPIPSGRMEAGGVLAMGFLLACGGLALLYAVKPVAALLGGMALFWYNVVYTFLKRRSPYAAVPGGLVGALPPVIGWTAAGGHALDRTILGVAFFFFMWQVPHFWLLLLSRSGEYRRAGLPTMRSVFSERQLSRVTSSWITSLAASCMLIPLFVSRGSCSPYLIATLAVISSWLLLGSLRILLWKGKGGFVLLFKRMNLYALLVVSVLVLEAELSGRLR